jgi:hypothetical protein
MSTSSTHSLKIASLACSLVLPVTSERILGFVLLASGTLVVTALIMLWNGITWQDSYLFIMKITSQLPWFHAVSTAVKLHASACQAITYTECGESFGKHTGPAKWEVKTRMMKLKIQWSKCVAFQFQCQNNLWPFESWYRRNSIYEHNVFLTWCFFFIHKIRTSLKLLMLIC